jgi:hypothetical protein
MLWLLGSKVIFSRGTKLTAILYGHSIALQHDRLPMQEILQHQQTVASLSADRDNNIRSAENKCRELSQECNHRKACQEALARQLALRDQELAVMRVQANNQRLGTVVQRFASAGMDGPQESFEPAFAYHQLQQVCFKQVDNCFCT